MLRGSACRQYPEKERSVSILWIEDEKNQENEGIIGVWHSIDKSELKNIVEIEFQSDGKMTFSSLGNGKWRWRFLVKDKHKDIWFDENIIHEQV